MKRLRWLLLAGGLAGAGPAAAGWAWQGSVGWLSDKVVYGISQSNGQGSAVVDLGLRGDTGWVASAGLATLPAARGRAELSASLGRGGAIGELGAWQASVTAYDTLAEGPQRRAAYQQLGLGYAWNERLQISLWLAPRQPGPAAAGGRTRGRVAVAEAGWQQPLGRGLGLTLGLGQVDYQGLAVAPYRFGSLGLSYSHGPLQVFASWVSSNSGAPAAVGPRALVSVLLNF